MPDTLDGRFDLIALHAFLLIHRLQAYAEPGPALAQAVFDAMFSDMDHNLREIGVSDLSVGKRMRAMWEAFHGRSKAYAVGDPGGGPSGAGGRARPQRLAWRGTGRRGRDAGAGRAGAGRPSGRPAASGARGGARCDFLPAAEASR